MPETATFLPPPPVLPAAAGAPEAAAVGLQVSFPDVVVVAVVRLPCFAFLSSFFSFRLDASSNFPVDDGRDEIISTLSLVCFFLLLLLILTFRCSLLSGSALFWRLFGALWLYRLTVDMLQPFVDFDELAIGKDDLWRTSESCCCDER